MQFGITICDIFHKVMSPSCHHSHVSNYAGDTQVMSFFLPSIALAFATKMSNKREPTSPSAIQVKTISGRQSVLKRN
jgi:hypothetical protein